MRSWHLHCSLQPNVVFKLMHGNCANSGQKLTTWEIASGEQQAPTTKPHKCTSKSGHKFNSRIIVSPRPTLLHPDLSLQQPLSPISRRADSFCLYCALPVQDDDGRFPYSAADSSTLKRGFGRDGSPKSVTFTRLPVLVNFSWTVKWPRKEDIAAFSSRCNIGGALFLRSEIEMRTFSAWAYLGFEGS